jgi:dienelactone hydrolase
MSIFCVFLSKRSDILKRLGIVIGKLIGGLVVALVAIQVIWYQIDGLPTPETDAYMNGSNFSVTTEDNGSFWFTPRNPNGAGIVIMHGALILPGSYAQSAAYFAARGFTVYLPKGPLRMSIAATGATAEAIARSDLDKWFFIGHSMGGMASLDTIRNNSIDAQAVALWATSMPSDFSDVDVPILFIWGDSDGLLPPERFANAKKNLPANTQYITLSGANHKNFAMYSHQFFDSPATLDWDEQINFANETTLEFFLSRL